MSQKYVLKVLPEIKVIRIPLPKTRVFLRRSSNMTVFLKPLLKTRIVLECLLETGSTQIHLPETKVFQKRVSEANVFLKRLSETLHVSPFSLGAWQ